MRKSVVGYHHPAEIAAIESVTRQADYALEQGWLRRELMRCDREAQAKIAATLCERSHRAWIDGNEVSHVPPKLGVVTADVSSDFPHPKAVCIRYGEDYNC